RRRHARLLTAVVALQRRRLAMQHQPRAAARATRFPAARAALQRRRESAAVDEDERLLAALEPPGERVREHGTDAVAGTRVAIRREHDGGKPGAAIRAFREVEAPVAS